MLDFGQWQKANDLGNAMRVGNDPDVQFRLSQALLDPNASEIIRDANFIATQHMPWDVHGPNGMGVNTIRMNQDNTLELVNNWNGSSTNAGKILNLPQLELATNLGNALRVGNDPDVQFQLMHVVSDPDAREMIKDANFWATQHADWDVHGPNGMGEESLRINPDNTIAVVHNATGYATNIAKLG